MIELEQKGIKVLFRGTTRNMDNSLFIGNPNSQIYGISTSTDPIVSTIFAIESATNTSLKPVLQIGLLQDLRSLPLSGPNYRFAKELEVVIRTPANNFSNLAKVEIPINDARKLINEIYSIDLPNTISRSEADYLLETIKKSTLEQSFEFYKRAIKFNIK